VNESFTAVSVQRIALDTRAIGLSFKWLGVSIALGTKSFVGKTRLPVAVTGTLHKCMLKMLEQLPTDTAQCLN